MNSGGDLVLVSLQLSVKGGVEDRTGEGLEVGASSLGGGGCMSNCSTHRKRVLWQRCSLGTLLIGCRICLWLSMCRLVLLWSVASVRVLCGSMWCVLQL